jgi:DnaJ-class molecular chaperone
MAGCDDNHVMSDAASDPYAVLGVSPEVSDAELRRVYRDLVKRHHPDHNGGSPESTARFAQIQNAYAVIAERRRGLQDAHGATDARVEERIEDLERELAKMRAAELRQARERARQAAAKQAAANQAAAGTQSAQPRRPTPEELGYYSTDDSFTKIIDDAADQLAQRVRGGAGKRQFAKRLTDLFGRGQ